MSGIKGYTSRIFPRVVAQKRNGGDGIRSRFSRSVHRQKSTPPSVPFYHLYEWDTIYEWWKEGGGIKGEKRGRGEKQQRRYPLFVRGAFRSCHSFKLDFVLCLAPLLSRALALASLPPPPLSSAPIARAQSHGEALIWLHQRENCHS